MSLFGGIFHAIGNLFDGQDDDKKKKQQQAQQQSAPVKAAAQNNASAPAPGTVVRPSISAPTPYASAQLNPAALAKISDRTAPILTPQLPVNGVNQPSKITAPSKGTSLITALNTARNGVIQKIVKPIVDVPINTVKGSVVLPAKALYQQTVEHNLPAAEETEGHAAAASLGGFGGGAAPLSYVAANKIAGNDPDQLKADLATLGLTTRDSPLKTAAVVGGDTLNSTIPLSASSLSKVLAPSDAVKIAVAKNAADTAASTIVKDDVAPGISSVNPTKEADVAAAQAVAAPPPPPAPPEVVPGQMNDHETAALTQLNTDAKSRVLTPDEKTMRDALQEKSDSITAANQPLVPAVEPQVPAATPAATDARTAPNAGELRAATEKQLKKLGATVDSDPASHDVLSNPELTQAGKDNIDTLTDQQLLDRYHGTPEFHGAADVSQGLAAMQRLAGLSAKGDEEATAAIGNILDASAKEVSRGGRVINYAKEFYNGLPKEAKVPYLIKNIDKVREKGGMGAISDDVAARAAVEDRINGFLTVDENIKTKVAELEDYIQKAVDDPANSSLDPAQLKQFQKQLDDFRLKAQKNNGDLAKYYDTLVPKQALGERFGDTGRTLMLSSVAGRGNDIITTAINAIHTLISMTTESLAGKVLNTVTRQPGKYISKLPSARTLVRGGAEGLRKSGGEFRGNVYSAEDLPTLMRSSNQGGRTQLMRAVGNTPLAKARRFIRAGAEVATNFSAGIKDVQLERLADQEGRAAGFTGKDLKTYVTGRAKLPTKAQDANATALHEEVNNLNDNRISNFLGRFADNISKLGGAGSTPKDKFLNSVGEQVRNLTVPFTRWAGGNLWNAVADKNVLANFAKVVNSARKGDSQGVVTNLSKLTVNSAATMTLGYALAKSGMLTTKDPEGYDDAGLYLHVGDRYIPAGFLGFFAPAMIMGSSAYDVMNDPDTKNKNVAEKTMSAANDTFEKAWRSYSLNSIIGQDNPVAQTIVQSTQKGSNTNVKDVAATAGSQIVSQYIPAFTGDINSVANNGVKIGGKTIAPAYHNPTHEAPLTKVTETNPKTGNQVKDYEKTAVNQIISKIPGAAQHLPRKTGVAAPDEIDRTTRGERATNESDQAAAEAKTVANVSADDKKAGIPDPNATYPKGDSFDNAVEVAVEKKNYTQAAAGLQQQLDGMKKDSNIPETKKKAVSDQIKTINVLKSGNYDPSIRDIYTHMGVDDWRNLGDSDSDTYNPKLYNLLYAYDSALAKAGVSGVVLDQSANKYTVKTPKSGSGSATSKAGGDLGSTPDFKAIDLSALAPKKINANIPTIQQVKPGELIKKRAISVGKG